MRIRLPTCRRYCDGLTRRDFLVVGGLSALGLSMGNLLEARAASAASTAAAEW